MKIRGKFKKALNALEGYVEQFNVKVVYTRGLDPFFKGDLDGRSIIIKNDLPTKDKLFNLIHLLGHTVQWNVDIHLKELGSILHKNPSDELIGKLQNYEWEANCYGLFALHKAGIYYLDEWLYKMYVEDIYYLTHFYKTGEKLREKTDISLMYQFSKELEPKEIPAFIAKGSTHTRQGIVIDFG